MTPTACPAGAFPPYGPLMTDTALTVHQTARPHGFPTARHFAFVESALPEPRLAAPWCRTCTGPSTRTTAR